MKNHEDSYKYHLGFWTEKNHKHIFFNLTKLIYTHASGHVNFWDFKLVKKKIDLLDFHVLTVRISKLGDKPCPLIESFGKNFRPRRLIEQDTLLYYFK